MTWMCSELINIQRAMPLNNYIRLNCIWRTQLTLFPARQFLPWPSWCSLCTHEWDPHPTCQDTAQKHLQWSGWDAHTIACIHACTRVFTHKLWSACLGNGLVLLLKVTDNILLDVTECGKPDMIDIKDLQSSIACPIHHHNHKQSLV